MTTLIDTTPYACSTPFGITDEVTEDAPGRDAPRHQVLNAFRHHG